MSEMLRDKPAKRSYQSPTVRGYRVDDLWRELGPAQALTGSTPRNNNKLPLPDNPLRIPPSK
jgi:hypothetical protein